MENFVDVLVICFILNHVFKILLKPKSMNLISFEYNYCRLVVS